MNHAVPHDRSITRVRHDLRRRDLIVVDVERVTPNLVRITAGGQEMEGFESLGFDDHCKLFLPSTDPAAPERRDYTPHHHDEGARTVQFDFALHAGAGAAGPATAWAAVAQVGDALTIGGPRGSSLIGTGFDWHLLVGDDTALPAIGRRLAELPSSARALVIAEVAGAADEVSLPSAAEVEMLWVHRGPHGSGLVDVVRAAAFPQGDFHAWVACESADAKDVRAVLLERDADRSALKASGYWRRGEVGAHELLE